jgi:hypothetical protein
MNDVENVRQSLKEVQVDIQEVKVTVDRIKTPQPEDIIGILKVNTKKTVFEFDYLNNRLTEMDKRIYALENR